MAKTYKDPKTGTEVQVHEGTGLAPVTLLAAYQGYNPGETAGFPPEEAVALVAQNVGIAAEPDESNLTPTQEAEAQRSKKAEEAKGRAKAAADEARRAEEARRAKAAEESRDRMARGSTPRGRAEE